MTYPKDGVHLTVINTTIVLDLTEYEIQIV